MELLLLLLLLKMAEGGLKPGMTGLVTNVGTPGKAVGMVALMHAGKLGWTNVLPADNAVMRASFGPSSQVFVKVGNRTFKGIRDGDGPQGGPFFRA